MSWYCSRLAVCVCVCVFTVARPTGQSDLRSGYRHDVSSIYAKIIGQGHGSKQCRLKCLRMQGNGIPASDYWQTAFLHLQVRKMHRNGRRNATGTVVYDQMTTSVQNNWSLIKHKYRLRKKKGKYGIEYSLAPASDGPCFRSWRDTLKMEFPHLRFSTLTAGSKLKITGGNSYFLISAEGERVKLRNHRTNMVFARLSVPRRHL